MSADCTKRFQFLSNRGTIHESSTELLKLVSWEGWHCLSLVLANAGIPVQCNYIGVDLACELATHLCSLFVDHGLTCGTRFVSVEFKYYVIMTTASTILPYLWQFFVGSLMLLRSRGARARTHTHALGKHQRFQLYHQTKSTLSQGLDQHPCKW